MIGPTFDLMPFLRREQGQRLDRKSVVETDDDNAVFQYVELLSAFWKKGAST